MGEFAITSSVTAFVWMVSIGIIGINIYIVVGFLFDEGISSEGAAATWLYALTAFGAFLYLGFILFLMRDDLQKLRRRAESLFWELGRHDQVGFYALNDDSHPGDSGGRPELLQSTSEDGSLSPLERDATVGDERREGDDTRA